MTQFSGAVLPPGCSDVLYKKNLFICFILILFLENILFIQSQFLLLTTSAQTVPTESIYESSIIENSKHDHMYNEARIFIACYTYCVGFFALFL